MPLDYVAAYLVGGGPRPIAMRAGDLLTFGRDPQNSVFVEDAMASRQHAILECTSEGALQVKDLGSSNGTFVNEVRMPPQVPQVLAMGDYFRIGGRIFSLLSPSAVSSPGRAAARTSQQLSGAKTLVYDNPELNPNADTQQEMDQTALNNPAIARAGSARNALSGNLRDQDCVTILQFLNANRKTGELQILGNVVEGLVSFDDGQAYYAHAGPVSGFDAVFRLVQVNDGVFQFKATAERPERPTNIADPTMSVILECCRRLDEQESGEHPSAE